MIALEKNCTDGADRQTDVLTERHGDSMTESAQWGRFSKNPKRESWFKTRIIDIFSWCLLALTPMLCKRSVCTDTASLNRQPIASQFYNLVILANWYSLVFDIILDLQGEVLDMRPEKNCKRRVSHCHRKRSSLSVTLCLHRNYIYKKMSQKENFFFFCDTSLS